MKTSEYHVGCGLAGIYAGTIKKPGEWKNKSEVTSEALRSVAEYMVGKIKPGDKAYEITWTNQTTGNKIRWVYKLHFSYILAYLYMV